MRRVVQSLMVVAVCSSPTAAWAPSVHGMAVDLTALYPPGTPAVIGYVCESQEREYVDSRGRIHVEVDKYVQLAECPKERIP